MLNAWRLMRSYGGLWILSMSLLGCQQSTRDLRAVQPFELERYLGRWYEIGRITHSFEKGLTCVTAEYEKLDDGGVKVTNRGYDSKRGLWKTATGKARFAGAEDAGWLKVSFFWIFYGDYKVILMDGQYQWAVVTSGNRGYLWILCRRPNLEEGIIKGLLEEISRFGYDLSRIDWVEQGERCFRRDIPMENRKRLP